MIIILFNIDFSAVWVKYFKNVVRETYAPVVDHALFSVGFCAV